MSLQPFALPERYRLEGGIAAGGMAAVYAAHDLVLDRPVAVKVLADHLNDDPTARARFEREGRAAAALSNHPGVVTIFDVGEFNGRAFIVMERRDGGTIADAGRVDHDRAIAWLTTVAGALDTAHERGVVHRDIKPGNLLLDDLGGVAVADFGIASLADDSERFTQTGQVLGTAAYLSPEQASGDSATFASDRYSLAVVAYELLTGQKPFQTGSFAAQARAHIEEPPPDAPGLPRQASEVLKRGLAKRPEDRWPTATAFVDSLREALTAAPAPAPAPTLPATEATRPLAGAAAAGRPPAPSGSTGGRRTGTVLALFAVALVIAAGVGIAMSGGGDDGGADNTPTKAQAGAKSGGKAKDKARTAPAAEETTAPAPAEPEPTEEPTEAPTEAPTTAPAAVSGDPAELNAEGYDLYLAGDYDGAIPLLRGAVESCGDSTALDPCGYAIYNLGSALHRNGQSAEAIPFIEDRLARFEPFKVEEVEAELAAAQAAAG